MKRGYLYVLAILAIASIIFLYFEQANAGGPANFVFSQGQDCSLVASWEIVSSPVTAANPNPTFASGTVVGSIANASPVSCIAASNTVSVPLNNVIGNSRFWLVAVSNGPLVIRSNPSNGVTVNLPLASPSGLNVVVP